MRKQAITARAFQRLFLFLKLKPLETRIRDVMTERRVGRAKAERIVADKRRFVPKGASADFIYIRLFKDIPEHDVQLLFPNRQVAFRPFDKIKFGVTAGGGTMFGLISTTGKLAAATSPFAIVGAMIGFIALLARQIKTFFNHRTRYMAELAQKLFFHNLATNRAALTILLDRAEEEELKEDLYALAFLAGRTVDEHELSAVKAEVEASLRQAFRVGVDFEIDDAMTRLEADGVLLRGDESAVSVPSITDVTRLIHARLDAMDDAEAEEALTATATEDAIEETA